MRIDGRWALALLVATLAACGAVESGTAESRDEAPLREEATMVEERLPGDEALRERLTPLQYEVTQRCGTEPPFSNAFWDHHEPGIYVDVVSGEPLFSSLDKFDSGSGWPSFTRPLEGARIEQRVDRSHGMVRTEVRSDAGSHLGHVFEDGPRPTGLRYCVNSAALRFVPAERLEAEGFGRQAAAFRAAGILPAHEADAANEDEADVGDEPLAAAIVAGGCFWGVEHLMRQLDGVVDTEAGYCGGTTERPTYSEVCTGRTGHAEAVRVVFDPVRVGYAEVLRYFFRIHDPTTRDRQHNDVGSQYRSAIFYRTEAERAIAERVRDEVDASGAWPRPVVTEVVAAGPFWPAEESHQDYLVKHPDGYSCHFLRPEPPKKSP